MGTEHKIFVNGVLSTTINDAAYQTATKFGFAASGASSARFDDFLIETMGTADPVNLPVLSELSPANNTVITASSTTISARVTDVESQASDVYLEISKTQDFAILTHNLTRTGIVSGAVASFSVTGLNQGNYYWRMRASMTGNATYTAYTARRGLFVNIPTSGRLSPDSILSMTGAVGALADIQDDPDSPNGSFIATDGLSDTAVRVSMPSTPPLLIGANLQNFRVQVQKSASTTTTGSVTIYLYEDGIERTSQTFTVGTGNAASVHQLSWNASLLSDSSGANVEVRVLGVGVYGGKASNKFGVNIGAIK